MAVNVPIPSGAVLHHHQMMSGEYRAIARGASTSLVAGREFAHKVGDIIELAEIRAVKAKEGTRWIDGDTQCVRVTHITSDVRGLEDGFSVLSIRIHGMTQAELEKLRKDKATAS